MIEARKVIQGTIMSGVIVLLPACGNLLSLHMPQLWLIFIIGILANIFQPSYKPFDKSAPSLDRGTALQNLWTACLLQLAAIIEAVYFRYPKSFDWDTIVTLSFVIMVLGLILRSWAVFTLGRFFTWHVEVQSDQKVIRCGPYRFVRHPSYTGAIMTYFFGTIFLHAWVSACLALILLPLTFMRRIRLEETTLKNSLGKEYEVYCREVKALIPGIW